MAKIMIVDDELQTTRMLEKVLSKSGYETISENMSSNAMQTAYSASPDLIILDLMMPEPDGFKLCKMLRANIKFEHIPILIVTALSDINSQMEAYKAGANDYLAKPYDITELKQRVEALIENSE